MTPGSSLEQTMMGRSPRCYIPSFVEISPLVPEKNLRCLKGFTIYGHGGNLGHVTYPRRLHIKFGFDWPSGFGEENV